MNADSAPKAFPHHVAQFAPKRNHFVAAVDQTDRVHTTADLFHSWLINL